MQEEEREELNGIMEMKKKNVEFQLRRGERKREEEAERQLLMERKKLMERMSLGKRNSPVGKSTVLKNGSAHVMVEDIECSEF